MKEKSQKGLFYHVVKQPQNRGSKHHVVKQRMDNTREPSRAKSETVYAIGIIRPRRSRR